MLVKSSITLLFKDGSMTDTVEDTRNSFGWRIMTERKQARLTQNEVCERLEKEFGIKMTYGALSQIETGETKRFHIDQLFAFAKIFNVDPYTLLTGEERGEVVSYSEEAEQVARLVDRMQPASRKMIVSSAIATLELENELRTQAEKELLETQRELVDVLKEDISYLENGVRRKVDAYIDRIVHRTS